MHKFIANIVLLSGLVLSLIVFLSLAKQLYWAFDLLTHFYLQYAVLLIAAFVFVLIVAKGKSKGLALLLIPALVIVLVKLMPFFIKQDVAAHGSFIKVVSLNVYYGNPQARALATYLTQEDADLVLLTEITPPTMQILKTELANIYPYIHDASRHGAFGIALFSKEAFDSSQTVNFRPTTRRSGQSIVAEVGGVTFIGMHPLPPTAKRYAQLRDGELAKLQSFVEDLVKKDADVPLVLLGDFNASPWSHPMESLFRETPVKHGGTGLGLQGIWPTWRIYGRGSIVFGAPIDHILISEPISTVSYKTKLIAGSDHSAVIGEFILPPILK